LLVACATSEPPSNPTPVPTTLTPIPPTDAPEIPTEALTEVVLEFPTVGIINNIWIDTLLINDDGTIIGRGVSVTYVVDGDQIIITAPTLCSEDGIYQWSFFGKTQNFITIKDDCHERGFFFGGFAGTEQ